MWSPPITRTGFYVEPRSNSGGGGKYNPISATLFMHARRCSCACIRHRDVPPLKTLRLKNGIDPKKKNGLGYRGLGETCKTCGELIVKYCSKNLSHVISPSLRCPTVVRGPAVWLHGKRLTKRVRNPRYRSAQGWPWLFIANKVYNYNYCV